MDKFQLGRCLCGRPHSGCSTGRCSDILAVWPRVTFRAHVQRAKVMHRGCVLNSRLAVQPLVQETGRQGPFARLQLWGRGHLCQSGSQIFLGLCGENAAAGICIGSTVVDPMWSLVPPHPICWWGDQENCTWRSFAIGCCCMSM